MPEPDQRLQEILLGGSERYTRAQMIAAAHLPAADARRLWRAMGFPDMGDSRAFTDADLGALLRIAAMIERGVLDLDTIVQIARSLGQTTARLADWQLDTLVRSLTDSDPTQPVRAGELAELEGEISELLPELEELLVYVWRRQMAATVGRGVADLDDEVDQATSTATVGFADLVSFTRLARQLDESELGALVESFESASADIVHAGSGRLVKTLGDEIMFVAGTPERAARISVALHDLHSRESGIPELRIGLATGAVLARMGDVYGTTVNRASRNTALAKPGTTVLDSVTAEALESGAAAGQFNVRALAPRPVRGFGIVRPYALSAREGE